MEDRGLIIEDKSKAKHYLTYIGYYRFTGYCVPFQRTDPALPPHTFQPCTTFQQVLDCYVFDRELRLLALDAIERIEVAFRTVISNTMCEKYGPHWFLNKNHFDNNQYFDQRRFLKELGNKLNKKRSQKFIRNYYAKYNSPKYPASWMMIEILSFGDVSKMYANLKLENRKEIAKVIGPSEKVLKSWMQALNDLRNDCAHHSRIYDRVFHSRPKIAKHHKSHIKQNGLNDGRFYAQALMMSELLKTISPESQWNQKLESLLSKYQSIPIQSLGFPSTWKEYEFWGLHPTS